MKTGSKLKPRLELLLRLGSPAVQLRVFRFRFRRQLRKARIAAGFKNIADAAFQLELQYRIKCSRDTLGDWETGASEPKASAITAMSRLYGVPREYFYEEDP